MQVRDGRSRSRSRAAPHILTGAGGEMPSGECFRLGAVANRNSYHFDSIAWLLEYSTHPTLGFIAQKSCSLVQDEQANCAAPHACSRTHTLRGIVRQCSLEKGKD